MNPLRQGKFMWPMLPHQGHLDLAEEVGRESRTFVCSPSLAYPTWFLVSFPKVDRHVTASLLSSFTLLSPLVESTNAG